MFKRSPRISTLHKAWLRSRLQRYSRALEAIAALRANDVHAERLLQHAAMQLRLKLQSL